MTPHFQSGMSRWQTWWINTWPHRWHLRRHVPKFLRACPDPVRGEVLEIGAGHGWTSQQILRTFPQVELTATDIDRNAADTFTKLRQDYGRRLKLKEANVLKLPFDRDSFDIVIAINVVGQLRSYGVRKALQELLRVTRPGGLIGISDHSYFLLPLHAKRSDIEEILQVEDCEIAYARGGGRYDLWIRKRYPIEQTKF